MPHPNLFQPLHEQFVGGQAVAVQDGFQAGFDEILLVRRDHDPAEVVDDLAKLVECGVAQCHGVVLGPSSEATVGPIRSRGKTSST